MTESNSTRAFRSRYMALLARRRGRWLATLACTCSAAAMLAACDSGDQVRTPPPTEEVEVYKSLSDCKAVQTDASACDNGWENANQIRDQQPAYSRKEQCEEEYGVGNCETRHGAGGNWFVPAMAGFMLSNAINNRPYNSYGPVRREDQDRGGGSGGGYPVYVNRNGNVSTNSGRGTQPLNYRVLPGDSGRRDLPTSFTVQRDPAGGYVAPGTYGRESYTARSRGGFGKSSSFRGGCCG